MNLKRHKLVNPLQDIGALFNTVQAPSRYLGGEFGSIIKPHTGAEFYNVAIAFPDLYEIGMANLAIKIIYNALNALPQIRCERVFAPDIDFETLLKTKNIPLYTLETGMPLHAVDMLAFSIGYELGATEILAMLEAGHIPLLAADRGEDDPLVIAGGCGITNPAPFGQFFDAIMIGEAEAGLFSLVEELAAKKAAGKGRKELLAVLAEKPFIWTPQSAHIARRAVQADFGLIPSVPSWFPQPSIKPVQDHGVVEIMRGCPNGCRFCHAGIYYRPMRVKSVPLIIHEIDHLVFDAGYREISLNSLSSADFPDIGRLLDRLNARYEGYNVSFQLPSLKVNSFSLPILEKLSTVRKSGLTFAVETPEEAWQLSLNKEVYAQHLVSIIKEAKSKGWSSAKFYFMIGLPVGDYFHSSDCPDTKTEEETIVSFLLQVQEQTHIQCNVNIGVFIPKPHTPYQWVRQLSPEKAQRKMDYIFKHLPRGKFKVSRHNYDTTILEGLLSRGNATAGNIILSAFKKGARLDAWDEHLKQNMQYWREAFDEAGFDVSKWIYRDWQLDEPLPWDSVSLGPAQSFYKKEWERSLMQELSLRCASVCTHPCGICNTKESVSVHTDESIARVDEALQIPTLAHPVQHPENNIPILYRVVFYFTRAQGGEYTAYLSQVETFHKAILRSNLPFVFTAGFNPLPKIEFATALSLGVASYEEVASCCLYEDCSAQDFMVRMNSVLPDYYHIQEAFMFPVSNLRKREALSQNLWGGLYEYTFFPEYSAALFFESEAFRNIESLEKYTFSAAEVNSSVLIGEGQSQAFFSGSIPQAFYLQAPVSDKKFRLALELFFSRPWYEIAGVSKLHTIANFAIHGWTAQDEEKWRTENASFKKSAAYVKDGTDKLTLYLDLYKEIARINRELIQKKKELDDKKEMLMVNK